MYKERIESVLKEKGISKAQLAEMLGIKKQNVLKLLEARRRFTLQRVADVLDMPLDELLGDTEQDALSKAEIKPSIDIFGLVEVDGVVFRIKSLNDLTNLYSKLVEEE